MTSSTCASTKVLTPAASESTAGGTASTTAAPNTQFANERWCDVPDWEGLYQVSDMGRVKSLARTVPRPVKGDLVLKERILRYATNKRGYRQVSLCRNCKGTSIFIHRLVAAAFLGEANGREVNHISADKSDNTLANLEYVTHAENIRHASRLGIWSARPKQNRNEKGQFA